MPIFNYVREHRRFIRYASDNKLTSAERLLWYALIEIFNEESEGNVWTDDFIRISNNRVLMLCDPMGIDTMVRARNGLKQRGLIDFKPGSRNKENPAYRIKLFYPDGYSQNTNNPGGNIQANRGGNIPGNPGDNLPSSMGSIYINPNRGYTQTERYADDDNDDVNDIPAREEGGEDPITDRADRVAAVIAGFRWAFGRAPYPVEINRLVTSGWQMQFSSEMVNKALETAAGHGAQKPVDYALSILDDWRNNDVMQPHQVAEYQVQHRIDTCDLWFGQSSEENDEAKKEARRQRREENRKAGIMPMFEVREG